MLNIKLYLNILQNNISKIKMLTLFLIGVFTDATNTHRNYFGLLKIYFTH